MPLEFGLWRIDSEPTSVKWGEMATESHLEDILEADISIASPNRMLIGRQVLTDHGGVIDLPAMLVRLQAKCDRCTRDV